MNSGDLEPYKNIKISKSDFFLITILSLHTICPENEKEKIPAATLRTIYLKKSGIDLEQPSLILHCIRRKFNYQYYIHK